ncbi:hypothetical protein [Flammeovirga sp. SubArs3]|uniref:hypothetical protein n=1 Tax=Flammeovirga sp. SubArs3 TaxID=2995316 RepID=UPI00248B9554|nr:hypothetical protein [Flammeovirga sp. SubArs3]
MLLKILIVAFAFAFLFKRYSKVIIRFLMNVLSKRLMKMQQEQVNNFHSQQTRHQQPQYSEQFEKAIQVDEDMTIYVPKKKK